MAKGLPFFLHLYKDNIFGLFHGLEGIFVKGGLGTLKIIFCKKAILVCEKIFQMNVF